MADRPLPNTYWVLPGQWLAGEYPGGQSEVQTRERLSRLSSAGIDAFIDLTQPGELVPYDTYLPLQIDHVRKPIADHGTPEYAWHMQEILETIDALLARGKTIYLHCRAGIGRTGTVVACHLIHRGLAPEPALQELNRLWRQCARSATWPSVPETDAQVEYVRRWQPAAPQITTKLLDSLGDDVDQIAESSPADDLSLEAGALAAAAALRYRFTGALLGMAVGDSLSLTTQLRKPGSFTPVSELVGGGVFDLPTGAWTDDTAMALCLAESLAERDAFDARDQLQRYVRWQREGHLSATGQCIGITANVARALGSAQWRRQPFAGSHDPDQLDREVLPRCVPAVLFHFGDVNEAIKRAADSARTTCQAPVALDACRLFAAILHTALSGRPKSEVLATHAPLFVNQPLKPQVAAIAEGGFRDAPRTPWRASGATVLDTLRAVLAIFESTTHFREGVLAAANLGGDCDAVAAAFGALGGAYYSAAAIPATWRNTLKNKEKIESLSDRLLARAMVDLGG